MNANKRDLNEYFNTARGHIQSPANAQLKHQLKYQLTNKIKRPASINRVLPYVIGSASLLTLAVLFLHRAPDDSAVEAASANSTAKQMGLVTESHVAGLQQEHTSEIGAETVPLKEGANHVIDKTEPDLEQDKAEPNGSKRDREGNIEEPTIVRSEVDLPPASSPKHWVVPHATVFGSYLWEDEFELLGLKLEDCTLSFYSREALIIKDAETCLPVDRKDLNLERDYFIIEHKARYLEAAVELHYILEREEYKLDVPKPIAYEVIAADGLVGEFHTIGDGAVKLQTVLDRRAPNRRNEPVRLGAHVIIPIRVEPLCGAHNEKFKVVLWYILNKELLEYLPDRASADLSRLLIGHQRANRPSDQGDASFLPDKEFGGAKILKSSLGPNPASMATTLRFKMVGKTTVQIVLYNMQGRMVQSIHEGELTTGIHEFELDLRNVRAGTYLLRMDAGKKFVETLQLRVEK